MITELDPLFVFDRFVVGPANRLAAAAARRAAESLGTSYNPLVICGPSGLGKTHLLMGIGHLARSVEPELYVHYETIESFIDRLTSSIAAGSVDAFREATGKMRLLLLDDLQHVAGKARTQEELLRLWEAMAERGSQVVIASDRAPHDIPALDARLGSRLAEGLIVEIAPPEPETRAAILEQLLRERNRELPDDVVAALARLPIENVRELQGTLNRVLAAADLEQRPPDAAALPVLLGLEQRDAATVGTDEFGDFLSDITTAVEAVVETAPWRRRIAQAILRWEGDGIRTRRLEEALDADSAPDVDTLLNHFARDVARLRELQREAPAPAHDPTLFTDPDRLVEAEAYVASNRAPAPPRVTPRPAPKARATAALDSWFLDREKLAWSWVALDERLVEELD